MSRYARRLGVALLACATIVCATPARAQSGFIGAAISGDIARTGSVDGVNNAGSGEALSWSLRAGAPIAGPVGVEIEFARPSLIERDESPDVRILAGTALAAVDPALVPSIAIYPFKVHTSQRNTTVSIALSATQELSRRVALAYLGGVVFGRIERGFSYTYPPILAAVYPIQNETSFVAYETGATAGVEGRVGLTEHVQLVPGVRLLGIGGGWLLRSAVGLAWRF